MKTTKHILALLCVVTLGLHVNAETVEIKNPIVHYIDRMKGAFSEGEEIFMFLLDINGDGIKDVFLSREKNANARMGYIWDVYLSDGDKFYPADNGISVPDQLTISRVGGKDRIFFWLGTPKSQREILLLEKVLSESNSREISRKLVATIKFNDDLEEYPDADAVFSLLDSRKTIFAYKGKVAEIKKIYSEHINSK